MDATRRGKYSRQGVGCGATASGVVALLRSSFPSLSLSRTIVVLVVAKMKMQMLMHCPIGQTLAAQSRLTLSLLSPVCYSGATAHYFNYSYNSRVWVAIQEEVEGGLGQLERVMAKGHLENFIPRHFLWCCNAFMPPIMTH